MAAHANEKLLASRCRGELKTSKSHGNLRYPPPMLPPRKPMVNSPLIRPYFLGGVALGGYLRSPWKSVSRKDVPGGWKWTDSHGDRINGLVITDPYKRGMNWGYNLLTNHLLTSWDIQAPWFFGAVITWSNMLATSRTDRFPLDGGFVREVPLFQGNLGWLNIIIWPELWLGLLFGAGDFHTTKGPV